MTTSVSVAETPLLVFCLRRADDALILGHRLSEWSGKAPTLEEDLALSNIALDLIGQARALLAGLRAAQGDYLLTMDGDGQNDPRDFPVLLALVESGQCDLACGWRVDRHDSLLRKLHELRRGERLKLLELLTDYTLPVSGTEGFEKAEVTGGGVALDEVDRHTLESRKAPGVFLCGEMLDAYGPIGGHNFAWAWATGRAAGLGAVSRYNRGHVPIQT